MTTGREEGGEIFVFSNTSVHRLWGPSSPLLNEYQGLLSRVESPKRVSDHSSDVTNLEQRLFLQSSTCVHGMVLKQLSPLNTPGQTQTRARTHTYTHSLLISFPCNRTHYYYAVQCDCFHPESLLLTNLYSKNAPFRNIYLWRDIFISPTV